MFHYAEIKELAAFFHFFQTHQTFCKQFCIHQFDFAVSISVNDGFEIHHIQDLCLQVDTRSDFCQVHTIFFQLEYASFCDVHNFLFVLQSDIAVECDLFNVFQEFFLFTFLSDNYFTIFNFYFQTAGHARALLPLTDGEAQFELAEHIIEEGLSVRAVEAMVKTMLETAETPAAEEEAPKKTQSPVLRQIEDELKGIFATKVKVTQKKNKGKIEIEYYSDEDLDRLLVLMKKLETER